MIGQADLKQISRHTTGDTARYQGKELASALRFLT